ncbi:hypothetical protein C2845_PM02G03750 [Panicum miliaceum]|uniref:Uncharacterized protein n=1 Tax=Panicum miliaceum TaxID=4540 RepID=A0A3L6SCA6_PANMI|nr:hypothetical protein C2845_PM02G03750 [Panicum miliaceum]
MAPSSIPCALAVQVGTHGVDRQRGPPRSPCSGALGRRFTSISLAHPDAPGRPPRSCAALESGDHCSRWLSSKAAQSCRAPNRPCRGRKKRCARGCRRPLGRREDRAASSAVAVLDRPAPRISDAGTMGIGGPVAWPGRRGSRTSGIKLPAACTARRRCRRRAASR